MTDVLIPLLHFYTNIFFYVEQNRQNQTENVRAHVYYPLLNNQDIISAQIIWTSLPSGISQPTSYEVQIFTADADRLHIEVSIMTSNLIFCKFEIALFKLSKR